MTTKPTRVAAGKSVVMSRQRSPRIEPGAIFKNRFRLEREIGRGGLSIVYRAVDLVASRAGLNEATVALKIMREEPRNDPDLLALAHREARHLRDLVHPNIVRVYDMDMQGKVHFMVMQHLEGTPLSAVLKRSKDHRLEPPKVRRLVHDIGAALAFAHARKIVHADLKPGNIFIESSGSVKLIDFNIAYPVARPPKRSEEDTVAILGRLGAATPKYASPQRLAGCEPCPADDVFSLAVVTYLALTGRHPFGSHTPSEAAEAGVTAQPSGNLTRGEWSALRNALALDDAQRTISLAAFGRAFSDKGRSNNLPLRLFKLKS